ncbi:MAG TPA: TRAP transporter small permease [Ramlibacter sp.]|nr:TRAP transporter small permease [Ramlibacter sp.]
MTTKAPSSLLWLCNAMTTLAGLAYLAMTGLIVFDIVARRFLGVSTEATVELTGYLLALGMSAGMAGTLVQRAHVRIDVLIQKLGVKARAFMHVIALSGLLLTAAMFAWGAWRLVAESWLLNATDLSSVRTPLWIPQGAWWLGLCLFCGVALAEWAYVVRRLWQREWSDVDRMLRPKSYQEEAEETLHVLAEAREAGGAA